MHRIYYSSLQLIKNSISKMTKLFVYASVGYWLNEEGNNNITAIYIQGLYVQ